MDAKLISPDSEESTYRLDLTLSSAELKEQYDSYFQHGGMFVMIGDSLNLFSRVEVNLINSDSDAKLNFVGEVVHVAPAAPGSPRGVSLQFLNLDEALKAELNEFASPEEVKISPAAGINGPAREEIVNRKFGPDKGTEGSNVEDSKAFAAMVQQMEKPRRKELALTASRKQRLILLRLAGVDIVPELLENPNISVFELKEILKLSQLPHTIIEKIATNEDWNKSDEVRLGLFLNPKTPITIARKFLPYIKTKDLIQIYRKKQAKGALKQMVEKLLAIRLKKEPKPEWNK